jgi:ribosomal-protein-alanine acetyltransferase
MDLIIRQAEMKDIDTIAELDKLCFAAPWSRASFETEITNNDLALYIVAEVDDTVIGYAGLWCVIDEGHITNVAVHPDHRKKGVGEALVSSLLDQTLSEGIKYHTLEVRPSNDAAIALYTKFGFQPSGIRKKYYEDNGEDAIIMWRME